MAGFHQVDDSSNSLCSMGYVLGALTFNKVFDDTL